jgi:hypothetical protein
MDIMISLGLDLGMGALKVYGEHGGCQMLSQVSQNGTTHLVEGVLGLAKKRTRPVDLRFSGGSFFVGAGAHDYGVPVENLDFERLTGTSEIRALLYAALAQYQDMFGPYDAPLSLMVGLPFQMMSGDRAPEFQASVKKWMGGSHEWTADGVSYQVDVARVNLVPQALGALFDYAYSHKGKIIPDRSWALTKETGVLSIGFNTIELLVARERADVGRFTGGVQMGVRRLLEDLNPDRLWTLGELDMMLRNGDLDLKRALPNWADRITGAIESRWGRTFQRFEKVLVVGGGAKLLEEYLTARFQGKAVVLDDPVMSISHGLYKMAVKFRK